MKRAYPAKRTPMQYSPYLDEIVIGVEVRGRYKFELIRPSGRMIPLGIAGLSYREFYEHFSLN